MPYVPEGFAITPADAAFVLDMDPVVFRWSNPEARVVHISPALNPFLFAEAGVDIQSITVFLGREVGMAIHYAGSLPDDLQPLFERDVQEHHGHRYSNHGHVGLYAHEPPHWILLGFGGLLDACFTSTSAPRHPDA